MDHHCSSRDISACSPGRLYYRAARLSLIGTAGLDLFCRSFNPACGTPVTIDVSVVRAPVTMSPRYRTFAPSPEITAMDLCPWFGLGLSLQA